MTARWSMESSGSSSSSIDPFSTTLINEGIFGFLVTGLGITVLIAAGTGVIMLIEPLLELLEYGYESNFTQIYSVLQTTINLTTIVPLTR